MKLPNLKHAAVLDWESLPITKRPLYPPQPVGLAVKQGREEVYMPFGHLTGANTSSYEDVVKRVGAAIDSGRPLLFHNAKFDCAIIEEVLGLDVPWHRVHDTLPMLFLDDPRADTFALKPSAERLLGEDPEERDTMVEWLINNANVPGRKLGRAKGKNYAGAYVAWADVSVGGPYAIGDVARTYDLANLLLPNLQGRGMLEAYERERQVLQVVYEMERRGVRVDVERLGRDVTMYRDVMAKLDAWLRKRLKVGVSMNLDSDDELTQALVKARLATTEGLGVTKTGKLQANKEALERGITDKQVSASLRYRAALSTCLGTFMEPWLEVAQEAGGKIFTEWHTTRNAQGEYGAKTGRLSSTPNCLTGDAEVLTYNGWVRIDALQPDVCVMQYDAATAELTYTIPQLVKNNFDGELVVWNQRNHRLAYTPDHRILARPYKKSLVWRDVTAMALSLARTAYEMPISGVYRSDSGGVFESLDHLRFYVALRADGSVSKSGGVRFHIKKPRKLARLRALAVKLGLELAEKPSTKGRLHISTKAIPWLKNFLDNCGGSKRYGSWVLGCSQLELQELVKEERYWDGHDKGDSYSWATANKDEAMWFQLCCHLSGSAMNYSEIDNAKGYGKDNVGAVLYVANVKFRSTAVQDFGKAKTVKYSGEVYCLTVPTSYFLVRRGGRIVVTGNCQNIPNEFPPLFKELVDDKTLASALPACPFPMPPLPFVRRYVVPSEKGHILLGRDFSSQELRVLAHFEDGKMLQAYHDDPSVDLHAMAAELVTSQTGVVVTRKAAKTIAFGILYGIGLTKLSIKLGVDLDQAKRLRKAYLGTFPGIKTLQDELESYGRNDISIKTWGGREYFVEEPKVINGKLQRFEYKLLNYLIQGSSADLTKQSAIDYHREAKHGQLLLTVHDEIIISAPKEDAAKAMKELKEAMNRDRLNVPMLSDGESGYNWHDMKPMK